MIYSVYANKQATGTDEMWAFIYKHTMTDLSPFDYEDYNELADAIFEPVNYRGIKLGFTICYDSNHPVFSRMFGLNGVDVIINSTGGNVVRDKWYKYQQARAIENNCYNFVTMGQEDVGKNNSYVFGFSPKGKELKPTNIMKKTNEFNEAGTIYIYDTNFDDGSYGIDPSLDQIPTINKNSHLQIPVGKVNTLLRQSAKLTENIYVLHLPAENVIFCVVPGKEILKPEKVLPLLYHPVLSKINNKRYIIVNQHTQLDRKSVV